MYVYAFSIKQSLLNYNVYKKKNLEGVLADNQGNLQHEENEDASPWPVSSDFETINRTIFLIISDIEAL